MENNNYKFLTDERTHAQTKMLNKRSRGDQPTLRQHRTFSSNAQKGFVIHFADAIFGGYRMLTRL